MRVLLVTAEYPPAPCGGIGFFYRDLARELAAQGATVAVLAADPATSHETSQSENGVEVRRTPIRPGQAMHIGLLRLDASPLWRATAMSAAARRLAAEFHPDVVETHDWAAPLWFSPARPFVVRLHGASSVLADALGKRPPRMIRLLERRMLAQADARIAVSQWVRERSSAVFGLPAEAMRIIPNGVDVQRFRPAAGEQPGEQIVFAGTLREDKGVVDLLQALEIVFQQQPRATALLAGGPDRWHELPPRIRALLDRLQLAAPNRLRLLGRISQQQLIGLYRQAAVCVFPSRVEAFGLACAEAMSCGAPVIASRLAAGAEIVDDGRSGLLVDPREPPQIAHAILRLLSDPGLRRNLGAEARRRAVELYSMRLTAERTLALYHDLRRAKQSCQHQSAA